MSFVEKIFGKKNKSEEENNNEQEKDFESQEEINESGEENKNEQIESQEKKLEKNMSEFKEALESVDGEEGLQEKMGELGDEKINSIFNNDKIKKSFKKVVEAIGYASVSPLFASVSYVLAELNNRGYDADKVDPRIMALITVVGVALVEIGVVKSWNKEKKAKEERESGIRIAA